MSTLQQDIQIVLDHFITKGITLSLEDGNLKIKAPRGVVTASDLEHLKAHKQEIIDYLLYKEGAPQAPASQDATCCKCGAPAEHTSPNGYTYCTEHYQCFHGHAMRWRKHEQWGIWLCACFWEQDIQPSEQKGA